MRLMLRRWRRPGVLSDLLAVLLALSFGVFAPVRQWLGNPGFWAFSDVFAATLVFLVWMGRDGALSALFTGILWVCMLAVAGIMAVEIAPGLAVIFLLMSWRAWKLGRAPDGGRPETIRSYMAMMAAGVPVLLMDAWGYPGETVGVIMGALFFSFSAAFRMYPPEEWLGIGPMEVRGKGEAGDR